MTYVTASPLSGSGVAVLASSNPGSELDLHGGLGEGRSALGVGSVQSTDNGIVNEPVNLGRGPLNRVLVSRGERSRNGVVDGAVVGGGITLAEVVGLDLGVVTTNPLPIDLVEVVGLKDGAGDNSLALSGLDNDVDSAKEDVVVCSDGRSIALLVDNEPSTLAVVLEVGSNHAVEGVAFTLCEVAVDLVIAKGRVGRAG